MQGPADIPDHSLGLHPAESDDLRNPILTIFFRYILDNPIPAVNAEIHIDIRH